jgi:hydrogenase maturation protease
LLIFGYGNPSRGDDALGPEFLRRIEAQRPDRPDWPEFELLTDFQLQVEHALDLEHRERVLFVDASRSVAAPFSLSRVAPDPDRSYTTHSMRPAALLDVFQRVTGRQAPPSFLLAIRGESFELGAALGAEAEANLLAALRFFAELMLDANDTSWQGSH